VDAGKELFPSQFVAVQACGARFSVPTAKQQSALTLPIALLSLLDIFEVENHIQSKIPDSTVSRQPLGIQRLTAFPGITFYATEQTSSKKEVVDLKVQEPQIR
jgi:hypothetical protein